MKEKKITRTIDLIIGNVGMMNDLLKQQRAALSLMLQDSNNGIKCLDDMTEALKGIKKDLANEIEIIH